MGARVLGISCITNLAAGITGAEAVARRGHRDRERACARRSSALLDAILERLGASESAHRSRSTLASSRAHAARAARVRAVLEVITVGAAVRDGNGEIYAGANVENASYGAGVCAERNAIAAAVAAGAQALDGGRGGHRASPPAAPCGMCRQVLRRVRATILRGQRCVNDARRAQPTRGRSRAARCRRRRSRGDDAADERGVRSFRGGTDPHDRRRAAACVAGDVASSRTARSSQVGGATRRRRADYDDHRLRAAAS